MSIMMRALYTFFLWIIKPLVRRKLRLRARAEPLYAEHIEERFGYYAGKTPEGGFVWVHAVSLGETRAAAVLVEQLRAEMPSMRLVLTHGTATGRAQGKLLLRPGDVQAWMPWDTPGAVARFLDRFQPFVGLLIETEVWPNMVAECCQRGIALCLVNARMSEKSLRQSQRMAWLSRPAYRSLRAVWAQTEEDAQRLRLLGAPVRDVLGNFKYDATPNTALLAKGCDWRSRMEKPVVMLASSRDGEEQMLLDILKENWHFSQAGTGAGASDLIVEDSTQNTTLPVHNVQWMVVPRHPQRFDAVERLLTEAGFVVARRSQWQGKPPVADVWLGDTLGDMALYYGMSDVALLGGSFAPFGGQNLIEAAACGCPVMMGPHTYNFSQAAQWAQEAQAAWACSTMHEAVQRALTLAQDSAAHGAAQQAAMACSEQHRGAATRTARAVVQLLGGYRLRAQVAG